MKKFSFGFIAILVVALAVTSAFTTKSKPYAINTWERFGVQQNQVSTTPSAPTASQIKAKKIVDAFRKVVVSPSSMSSIATEISNYNGAQLPGAAIVRCATDADHVCASVLAYNTNDNTELTLIDYNTGDYSLVP